MQKMVKKLTGKSKKRGMLPGMGGLSSFGSPLAERDVPKSIYTKKRKERKKKKKQRKKSKKKK
jgi:hypothetical protein